MTVSVTGDHHVHSGNSELRDGCVVFKTVGEEDLVDVADVVVEVVEVEEVVEVVEVVGVLWNG